MTTSEGREQGPNSPAVRTAQPGREQSIVRLSIPGNECVGCGTVQGDSLVCPGCGHVDPLTRRPATAREQIAPVTPPS